MILHVPEFENHSSIWQVPFTFCISTFFLQFFCEMQSDPQEVIPHLCLDKTFVPIKAAKPQKFLAQKEWSTKEESLTKYFIPSSWWLRKTQGFLVFLSGNRYHLEIHFIIILTGLLWVYLHNSVRRMEREAECYFSAARYMEKALSKVITTSVLPTQRALWSSMPCGARAPEVWKECAFYPGKANNTLCMKSVYLCE